MIKIDFAQPRKWSLPLNMILFNLCRLNPFRNKKIWVFGGVEGKKFDDNSRYMFEYINSHHSDTIRAIWLTRKKATAQLVRDLGYEAYTFYSAKGIRALLVLVLFFFLSIVRFWTFPFGRRRQNCLFMARCWVQASVQF